MNTAEVSSSLCPKCQAPIPEGAPAGLCPKCLMAEVASPTQVDPAPSEAPTVEEIAAAFPDLEVLQILGRGGMGIVFKVRQPRLERYAALKVLPPHLAAQPDFAQRFVREARALARLSHPNIVGVYDFGQAGGFYYLMMEYIDGVNLREALRAERFTPEQALAVVPKLCDALQYAHDEGVLHRDIKPENILLDSKGRVKLADFGIAKLAGEAVPGTSITGTGASLGTPAYMAPEQIERPATVDHRADIYSLGVVFYEMLTGELPLGRFAPPSRKATLDTRIDDIVLRALEKERELRQQSATEMKTQVEGVATLPTAAPSPAAGRSNTLNRAAAVLLAMGIGVGMMLPLLIALGFGRRLDPATSAAVIGLFAMAAMVVGIVSGFRNQSIPPAVPQGSAKPWPRWKICGVIALFSLPIAGVMTMLAVPAVQRSGGAPIFGFLPFLIVPAITFCVAALLGLTFSALTDRGAPKWLAALICCAVLLFLGFGGIVALFGSYFVVSQGSGRPSLSPERHFSRSSFEPFEAIATEVQKLPATEDPGDRVSAIDFDAPPACVLEGRFFIERGDISRELPELSFAAYSDPDWGSWQARLKVTADSLKEPATFTRAVIGLQSRGTRGSEASEAAAWPRPTKWSPVRARRKITLSPGKPVAWEFFRGESSGWTAGEPANPGPSSLVVRLEVHPIPITARQERATFSIQNGASWWEHLSMAAPADQVRSSAVVTVDEAGNTQIEGQSIPLDQLAKRLKTIGLPRDAKIMIHSSPQTPAEAAANAVNSLTKGGYSVVLTPGPQPVLESGGKAPPPSSRP